MSDTARQKTYKREIACVIMGVYFILLLGGMWSPEAAAAAESLKYPAFGVLMGAFGMDAISKQFVRA